MGTNYHWRPKAVPMTREQIEACRNIGRGDRSTSIGLAELDALCDTAMLFHDPSPVQELHVGKSSMGWVFALHVYTGAGLPTNLEEWIERFYREGSSIHDEYGREVSPIDMVSVICNRGGGDRCPLTREWLAQNSAVQGPNGLARSMEDEGRVKHGAGTWDYHWGEFS